MRSLAETCRRALVSAKLEFPYATESLLDFVHGRKEMSGVEPACGVAVIVVARNFALDSFVLMAGGSQAEKLVLPEADSDFE